MIEFIKSNLDSIIGGVASSLVFLIALSRLKPKIRISDKISVENIQGERHYVIKVINKSLFFKVYDMKVRVYSIINVPSENNTDFHCDDIELRKDYIWFLNRLNWRHIFQNIIHGTKRLKKRTDYAAQFLTKENLNDLVGTNKSIRFEVLAKHSLSGFSVVKTYTFRHKNDLVNGSFLSGNTSTIKE
ncbi:hypothetical protein [Psychroserpens sp.]|uniref:hypothetical protein n=1 Tax=Psychroserpens sp. TaxID=2020870 RepID=UPI003C7868CC